MNVASVGQRPSGRIATRPTPTLAILALLLGVLGQVGCGGGTGAAVASSPASSSHSVSLQWTASATPGVKYNVYRGTSPGSYSKITAPPISGVMYTDTDVQAGWMYYYVVTAVDSSGVESTDSNEVSVQIP